MRETFKATLTCVRFSARRWKMAVFLLWAAAAPVSQAFAFCPRHSCFRPRDSPCTALRAEPAEKSVLSCVTRGWRNGWRTRGVSTGGRAVPPGEGLQEVSRALGCEPPLRWVELKTWIN